MTCILFKFSVISQFLRSVHFFPVVKVEIVSTVQTLGRPHWFLFFQFCGVKQIVTTLWIVFLDSYAENNNTVEIAYRNCSQAVFASFARELLNLLTAYSEDINWSVSKLFFALFHSWQPDRERGKSELLSRYSFHCLIVLHCFEVDSNIVFLWLVWTLNLLTVVLVVCVPLLKIDVLALGLFVSRDNW